MKPFLLLQLRPIDKAADNEYEAFLKYSGLKKKDLHRIRMEKEGLPLINLNDYSAIIEGGGPSNVSDLEEKKSKEQRRFEEELIPLYDEIFSNDFPFLGTCYGVGSIAKYMGGVVSRENFSEVPGVVEIELKEAAKNDPIFQKIPSRFQAFVGHKEACQIVPSGATLLASSATCPIQAIRVKKNIYAIQFHPELDFEGLKLRVGIYMYEGYFKPAEAKKLLEKNKHIVVFAPEQILQNFVEEYKKN